MAASVESSVSYRWAEVSDHADLGQLMYDSIQSTPSPYSQAERDAWCLHPPNGAEWRAKLSAQFVAIAQTPQGPAAMMSVTATGDLDLAFVHPAYRGHGHLRRLLRMITTKASALGLDRLTTHASLAAQAPFAALGFELIQHESIARHGQTLRRARMRLPLNHSGRAETIR